MLRNNGLVQTSIKKKENYVRFEIIDEKLALETQSNNSGNKSDSALAPLKRIPPRLSSKDIEKSMLTPDQIKEKLEQANQRRIVSFK